MGALDGIRVIDFGQYIAGPLGRDAARRPGGRVIRVDPPSRSTLGYARQRRLESRQAPNLA